MASSGSRRVTSTTRKAPSRTNTRTKQSPADELAEKLATTLRIASSSKSKEKAEEKNAGKARHASDPKEQRRSSMKAVNTASQTLSNLVQSGWKCSASDLANAKDGRFKEAKQAFEDFDHNVNVLRDPANPDLDIERAAVSCLGKLVSLEMYEEAFTLSKPTHTALCSLHGSSSNSSTSLRLLSIPIPSSQPTGGTTLLTLTSTYFAHVITTLTHLVFNPPSKPSSQYPNLEAFVAVFSPQHSGCLISWMPVFRGALESKQLDPIMSRVYTALTKACAAATSPTAKVNPCSQAIFILRIFASHCLLQTSPGVVEPKIFWDQVVKFGAVYVKTKPEQAEDEVLTTLLRAFENIAETVKESQDPNQRRFIDGQGWLDFCDYWMGFAKKAGDIRLVDRIANLIQGTPTVELAQPASNDATVNKHEGESSQGGVAEAARLSARFTQATTALEQNSPDTVLRLQEVLSQMQQSPSMMQYLKISAESRDNQDESFKRAYKVDRALERMRRELVVHIETSTKQGEERRLVAQKVLQEIASVYASIAVTTATSDILTRTLDVLFALARTTLNIADARTYVSSHEYLKTATSTISNLSLEQEKSIDVGNYLRCISGVSHNIAGTLYQNERHGAAIGFMKKACELGSEALERRRTSDEAIHAEGRDEDGRKNKTLEGWKQLEEQLYRRWELLGVCHSKIGERKEANNAFIQSITTFPFSTSTFTNLATTEAVGDLTTFWEVSSTIKQMGAMVDRVTYLGACELLVPPSSVSLASTMNGKMPSAVVGVLLERQIDGLEASRHKEEVRMVLERLFHDALQLYSTAEMPLRRARVLARCLEFLYHLQASEDKLERIGNTEEIAEEILEIVERKALGQDECLRPIRIQLQLTTYIWLALHSHRKSSSDVQEFTRHVEMVCSILRPIVASDGQSRSPKKSSTPQKQKPRQVAASKSSPLVSAPTTRQRSVARLATRKPVTALSAKAKTRTAITPAQAVPQATPVTPGPKGRKALQPLSANVPVIPDLGASIAAVVPVDFLDLEKTLIHVQLLSQIASLLGLSLIKTRLLDLSRRLCKAKLGAENDSYVIASVELGRELFLLGKLKRAASIFAEVSETVGHASVSVEARIVFLLRHSECLALRNLPNSDIVYSEALELVDEMDVEPKGSTAQRVQARVRKLELAAIASQVFSLIQYNKDDTPTALNALLRSLRLWTRVTDTLNRLAIPPPPAKAEEDNPFEVKKSPTPSQTPSLVSADQVLAQTKIYPRRFAMNATEWRASEALSSTLFSLGQIYVDRGSPREAEHFIQQAISLAKSLGSDSLLVRALTMKAEVQLLCGRIQESLDILLEVSNLAVDSRGVEVIAVQNLRGLHHELKNEVTDASKTYELAANMIEKMNASFLGLEVATFRRSSLGNTAASKLNPDTILPQITAKVLRRKVWLLREDSDCRSTLLERFLAVTNAIGAKADEYALLAKLAFHDIHTQLHDDMVLSSLSESTISVPTGISRSQITAPEPTVQNILNSLQEAEELYWSNLELVFSRGNVHEVREGLLSLAQVQAFQTSLGKEDLRSPILAAHVLDLSAALTLRREMLDAIELKFPTYNGEDGEWPRLDDSEVVAPPFGSRSKKRHQPMVPHSTLADMDVDSPPLKKFWSAVKLRYQSQLIRSNCSENLNSRKLPSDWTIIHISVTNTNDSLLLTRQIGGLGSAPLMFKVPLQGRRGDNSDGESLTFSDVINEMSEIVRLSDQGTRGAKHVKKDDPAARAAWWKERIALDNRLKELLENVEFCWLGAFKTIMTSRADLTGDALTFLSEKLGLIFHRSLRLPGKRPRSRSKSHSKQSSRDQFQGLGQINFSHAFLECLATLSPKCKDEELEDFVYLILDLYQLNGIPVAIAEVDITQLVVDLRATLEETKQKCKDLASCKNDEHIFLVLDRKLQEIPWESVPVLRGRSVSRIPSVDFLLDRLEYAEWKREHLNEPSSGPAGSAAVNARKGYFILNPSGDLGGTEGRFKQWASSMTKVGWDGIIGQPPSEQQFINALRDKDLVVYFGHGGGEQYLRSHKIRSLPSCAATMLWGCSSGLLKEMGEFDRVGTPYHYMLAGCPSLVANLWDVTDRDIDKFSLSVFDKLHLHGESIGGSPDSRTTNATSVVAAVAQSREMCKLRYLTGAAPIVYGIPFYL